MSKLIQPITLDMLHTPNERLLKFRAEHPCRYLDIAGVRWEYLVGGQNTLGAETLLLLTGGLRVAETAFVYVGLFENTYRVIVPTYPPVATIDEIIEGVATILDAEHASQVLVLGQSYGGLMAHSFVSRYPDRVKKIVFSSAGPFALTEGQQKLLKMIADLFSRLPERLLKGLWLRTLRPLISVPPAETAFWQTYLADLFEHRLTKADVLSHFRVATDAFKKYGYTLRAPERWPGPTLTIGGAKDPASTQSDRQQIAEFYPQAQMYVIPNAGHTVGMDKPEEYATAVREFFESADG